VIILWQRAGKHPSRVGRELGGERRERAGQAQAGQS